MINPQPIALEGHGIRLDPMAAEHAGPLATAVANGRLWKKDGVLRHHGARKDGSPRDTVMYSILAHEWPDVRRHLETRLRRHSAANV